jgi:metal-responsive CopG/Arc/MetJ family transcriptional regulator
MNENAKKVLISLPIPFIKEVDAIAKVEHRTRSDLIRESIRRYVQAFKLRTLEAE